MGIPKNRKKPLFQWEPFDNLESRRKWVSVSALPDRKNPVVVRFVTRSELAAISRNNYDVKVIKVRVPLMEAGEAVGEKELLVAITRADLLSKQLKNFRYRYRTIMRKNGGGGGGGDEPPSNPFCDPIDQEKMADCIIEVMDDIFHGGEQCTICDKSYSYMEFCVLMHIFFKKLNFLKKESRLPFSKFVQNKVLAGKSGFVRTYNTYADKDIYKTFEEELDMSKMNFRKRPATVPPKEKPKDYHQCVMLEMSLAFQEIGWHFQKSPYFIELKKLKETVNLFVLQ
jgi:hypothetical protein